MGKKSFLVFPILILSVILAHVVVAAGLTVHGSELSWVIFGKKFVESYNQKIWLAQTLGLWLSIYLFGLAALVMLMRIVTGKSSPASHTDPVYINTLNRIITNTIEQSIIFAGLFAPLLFSQKGHVGTIGGAKVLAIASLFIVGRVAYTIGYILGSITGISTFRSFGFAVGLLVNLSMISYHLGFNVYEMVNQHFAPIVKGFL